MLRRGQNAAEESGGDGSARSPIAERLRHGDREAFAQVYDDFLPYVLSLLQRGFQFRSASGDLRTARVESAFDAEELCQEIFSRFFAQCKSETFDTSRPIKPYLARMTINLALKRLGKQGREILTDDLPEGVEPPSTRIEDREQARLIGEFQAGLTEKEREILSAYCGEETVSQSALGARLGLSRDQISRALAKIRSQAHDFFQKRGWFDAA